MNYGGPTEFEPVLRKLINAVKREDDYKKYNILMILSDGVIEDMDETKSFIVEASNFLFVLLLLELEMQILRT